jgi:hypothetical protein
MVNGNLLTLVTQTLQSPPSVARSPRCPVATRETPESPGEDCMGRLHTIVPLRQICSATPCGPLVRIVAERDAGVPGARRGHNDMPRDVITPADTPASQEGLIDPVLPLGHRHTPDVTARHAIQEATQAISVSPGAASTSRHARNPAAKIKTAHRIRCTSR